MAERSTKATYPVIPVKHWWTLRERFKKSIPSTVNNSYVASVLNMSENSARANIIPSLKYTGIIDDEGKPTDRAIKWRDDVHYGEVCQEIRQDVYPTELLDIAQDPENDRENAQRWFANTTGSGQAAVNRMLAVYLLLTEADASKSTNSSKATNARNSTSVKTHQSAKSSSKSMNTLPSPEVSKTQDDSSSEQPREIHKSISPSLNLNIQIHISSEASPEQIEQIFSSMAKHLKNLLD